MPKRLIDEQELPTALVKPPKNVQDLLKEEPAELIKLRYGEDHYIDLFYPLDNPRVLSEMLECVATD